MGHSRDFTGEWPHKGRLALSLGLGAALLATLILRLGSLNAAEISAGMASVAVQHWAAAGLAMAISFAAVGGQEAALTRHLGLGPPSRRGIAAGIAAAAIGQTLGLGPVIGALVRWRMVPGLSLWQATRLSVAMAVGFMAALSVLAALVMALQTAGAQQTTGRTILAGAAALILLAAIRPRWLPRRAHWPNLFTLSSVFVWAALDLVALSLSLWLVFPPDHTPPFATLLPSVLTALAAGLFSGAPAGAGAFEMSMLWLLPQVDPAPLLAAILSWRILFYALPALIGVAWVTLAPRPAPEPLPHRAEAQLARQGHLTTRTTPDGTTWITGRTPHILVALFDPAPRPGKRPDIAHLDHAARSENRLPALYKCTRRTAATARRAGWNVHLTGYEAVVDPSTFTLSAPACAGLRRKLRKAATAGVTASHAATPPLPDLARIASRWAQDHGGERGFSMGRFCPTYLAGQRIYVAQQGKHIIAFVSFHHTPENWALDLMRHDAGVPDGTMHALIHTALHDAHALGIRQVSLAAVPITALGSAFPTLRALSRKVAGDDGQGLARFKSAFAPRWHPLYLAAPSPQALALASAEIAAAILRPAPLPRQNTGPHSTPAAQTAEYAFASPPASWHRKG